MKSKNDLVREWNDLTEESEKKRLIKQIKEKEMWKQKSPVDKLFDELLARIFTVLEATNVLCAGDENTIDIKERIRLSKETAIGRLIKDVVRDIQDRVKDHIQDLKS